MQRLCKTQINLIECVNRERSNSQTGHCSMGNAFLTTAMIYPNQPTLVL